MPTRKIGREDSPIWTQEAGTEEPFAELQPPDNLAELAAQVAEISDPEFDKRVAVYNTPVSQDALTRILR